MKLNTVKFGVLTLLLFAFSLSISAQEKKAPNFEKMLLRFDSDDNGSVSLDEFKSAKRKNEVPAERLEKNYAKLDGDSNGEVTLEELKTNWGKEKAKGKGKGKKKQ